MSSTRIGGALLGLIIGTAMGALLTVSVTQARFGVLLFIRFGASRPGYMMLTVARDGEPGSSPREEIPGFRPTPPAPDPPTA